MERESNPMQALCRSGCGFYGNPATEGLCSLCFKENLKKKQQPPMNTPASLSSHREFSSEIAAAHPTISHITSSPISEFPVQDAEQSATQSLATAAAASVTPVEETDSTPSPAEPQTASSTTDESSGSEDKDKDSKKKKNRCAMCKKKVGLTGFECRCGGLFCAVHRYSDKHNCSFDYREMGAQEIRRNNPVVVGEKIQKI